jgi:hypothetical protein
MRGEKKMTVKELIYELSKLDSDKEIYIAIGESDGEDFTIEESEFSVFLVSEE